MWLVIISIFMFPCCCSLLKWVVQPELFDILLQWIYCFLLDMLSIACICLLMYYTKTTIIFNMYLYLDGMSNRARTPLTFIFITMDVYSCNLKSHL
jgi:hypothetical protein